MVLINGAALHIVTAIHIQPSLIFASKAHKYETKLEDASIDKGATTLSIRLKTRTQHKWHSA